MQEKAYKSMGRTGVLNLVIGILMLVGSIASGILLIVHGGKLLADRKNMVI